MRIFILFWTFLLSAVMALGQQKVTVEAQNYEVSDNLDLEAVAIVFGQSENIEDFEKQLNNPDNRLSNLDLNNDGYVDFLRVVEFEDKGSHYVLIQSVIGEDLFQDVATIVVEGESKRTASVTVVGNRYIYGDNYVIEPQYVIHPIIYDWFWAPVYVAYYSRYYWNYYPSYYTEYVCWGYHSYYRHITRWCHSHYCDFNRPVHYTNNYITINTYNNISRNDYVEERPDYGYRKKSTPNSHLVNTSVTRRPSNSISTQKRGESIVLKGYSGYRRRPSNVDDMGNIPVRTLKTSVRTASMQRRPLNETSTKMTSTTEKRGEKIDAVSTKTESAHKIINNAVVKRQPVHNSITRTSSSSSNKTLSTTRTTWNRSITNKNGNNRITNVPVKRRPSSTSITRSTSPRVTHLDTRIKASSSRSVKPITIKSNNSIKGRRR